MITSNGKMWDKHVTTKIKNLKTIIQKLGIFGFCKLIEANYFQWEKVQITAVSQHITEISLLFWPKNILIVELLSSKYILTKL